MSLWDDFINRGWEDAFAEAAQGGNNTWVGDNGYIYDGTNNYGNPNPGPEPSAPSEPEQQGPEETPVIGDNGQLIYYGSNQPNTYDNKVFRDMFYHEPENNESSDEETSPGEYTYDPDQIMRDTYNEWYRQKNGLEDDGTDYFDDTWESFKGLGGGQFGYVGTAEDWYDLFNRPWREGNDRVDTINGGTADWSFRNDYAEYYPNLWTEENEFGDTVIPMEAIQQWYDDNQKKYSLTDEQIANLSPMSMPELYASDFSTMKNPYTSFATLIANQALANGQSPFDSVVIPGMDEAIRKFSNADDSEKNSIKKRVSNGILANALVKDAIKMPLAMSKDEQVAYLQNIANGMAGGESQYELANDWSAKAKPDNDNDLAYLMFSKNLPDGYHIRKYGDTSNGAANTLWNNPALINAYNNSPFRMG